MKEELRLVERKDGDTWVKIRLMEIKEGDTFRMFDGVEPVGNPDGMVAASDGYKNIDGQPTVEIVTK